MAQLRLLAVLVIAFGLAGCGGNRNKYLRRQAGRDLGCSEGQVRLSTLNKSTAQYLAEACGRRAVYTYSRDQGAIRISAIEGANVGNQPPPPLPGNGPSPGGDEVPPPPPPPPPPLP